MRDKRISNFLKDDKTESWFDANVVGNAPLILGWFANAVVIFADYRVYDVIYNMTGSWWKALSASLACAIPFILWEIGWQYNHTTDGWRKVSLAMAGLAFLTSIVLGVADFAGFDKAWAGVLLSAVVVLTGAHTVVALLYVYNDPDVARKRRKRQAQATMLDQQLNAQIAENLLNDGANLLGLIERLESRFDPNDVQEVLALLKGRKLDEPTRRRRGQEAQLPRNVLQPAAETDLMQLREHDNGNAPDPTRRQPLK